MRRWWETPKLVSNGAFRRIWTSRKVMDSIFIRLQKVGPVLCVELKPNRCAGVGKVCGELFANLRLDFLGSLRFIPADFPNGGRNRNPLTIRNRDSRLAGEHVFDTF